MSDITCWPCTEAGRRHRSNAERVQDDRLVRAVKKRRAKNKIARKQRRRNP